MFDTDGSVNADKLRVLSRSYPQATAGTLLGYKFHSQTGAFSMTYRPIMEINEEKGTNEDELTTIIYLNMPVHYPKGARVIVTTNGDAAVTVKCPDNSNGTSSDGLLRLIQIQDSKAHSGNELNADIVTSVVVSRCGAKDNLLSDLSQDCTCPYS